MDKKVFLIKTAVSPDAIGNQVKSYTERSVWGTIDSISQKEFFQAGLTGLKPECKVKVWSHEYRQEKKIRIDGKVFSIYRTYNRADGKTELYVSEKAADYGKLKN